MKRYVLIIVCHLLPVGYLFSQIPNNYLEWMQRTLPVSPEWTSWQKATGARPPDFHALVKSNLLPDPLLFYDGHPIVDMANDWPRRRLEIKQLFQKYVTGTFPTKPAITRVVALDEAKGDRYQVRNVRVEFGTPGGEGSVRIRLVIPESLHNVKLPVMISPSLHGWSADLVRRGYISAGYAGNDAMDDAEPLKELYAEHDFATLARRAWLAQLVIDYLTTIPEVDASKIAINGYSRDGKMAVIAAAFDERISAVIAGSTGVGGVVPWRYAGERGGGESIETTTRMFPTWFVPRLRFFSGREDYLPVDANLLLALIAPRAVLMEWGYTDQVANGWAMEQAYQSAQTVYRKLGEPDKLGLLSVPGFHGSNDVAACLDWLDWQFGRTRKPWRNQLIFPWDFNQWKASFGSKVTLPKGSTVTDVHRQTTAAAWHKQAEKLRKSVLWMLGEAPPVLAETPRNIPMGRRVATYGPTEIAKKTIGNPGQLAPDVPAWVIAAGGQSYGWRSPERDHVTSRRIRFNGVTGDLYYPAGSDEKKPLPTVIWLHGFHYSLGYMWVYRTDLHPIVALVNQGYAVLAYDQTGFGTRWNEAAKFYDRFPHWSRMGKMIEDLSAAITVLGNEPIVDTANISVFGFSMGGALGLYAAALDTRISAVVSVCGFTPMKEDTQDKGMSGMTRYSHLYGLIPRLGLFAGNEANLPYDFEDLIALIAPRPVLVVQPKWDRDANPIAVGKAIQQARNAYNLNGTTNKLTLLEPDDYGRMTETTQQQVIHWMKNNF